MTSASEISSEKRAGAERHRSTLGNGSRRTRRNEGHTIMVRNAIAVGGTKSAPPGCSVPNFLQVTAKEEFSAVIIDLRRNQDLSRKEIGKIAGVGSETVKAWEKGRQMGQFEHIARLSQSIKSVRQFALRQIGAHHGDLDFMSPQVVTAMVAALYQVAHQPGPDGDAVRAALAKMGKRE